MDGFNSYEKDGVTYGGGRVIDSVTISRPVTFAAAPIARVSRGSLRFTGVVALGMSQHDALSRLGRMIPPPRRDHNCLTWTEHRYNRLNRNRFDDVHDWTARLTFGRHGLDPISIFTN